MRAHCQDGVFQGHGSQEAQLPVLYEGHRSGELFPLQADDRPAPGTFHAASVGELGGVGALQHYSEAFQQLSGSLGECGTGVHQHLYRFKPLPGWVAYLDYYSESSYSCSLGKLVSVHHDSTCWSRLAATRRRVTLFAGSLLGEQVADLAQESPNVIEAVGDLLGGHEAVVVVLAEAAGQVEERADIGVASLSAQSADGLQVMAVLGVFSAPLAGHRLEHLDCGVPALFRGLLQVADSEILTGLGHEVVAGLLVDQGGHVQTPLESGWEQCCYQVSASGGEVSTGRCSLVSVACIRVLEEGVRLVQGW